MLLGLATQKFNFSLLTSVNLYRRTARLAPTLPRMVETEEMLQGLQGRLKVQGMVEAELRAHHRRQQPPTTLSDMCTCHVFHLWHFLLAVN